MSSKITIKSVIALLLVFALTLPAASFAAWDGYRGEEAETIAVDMNNPTTIFNAGGIPSKEHTRSASYALRWSHAAASKLVFSDVPSGDWSEYDALEFWMYSDMDYSNSVRLLLYQGNAYYYKDISIDWSGWKHFKYSIPSDFGGERGPDITKIESIQIACSGWNMTVNPKCVIWIDNINLRSYGSEGSLYQIYDGDVVTDIKAVMDNSLSISSDTQYINRCGEQLPLSKGNPELKAVYAKTDVLVPITVFSDYLEAKTEENVITLGERSVEYSVGSTQIKTNGETLELTEPVKLINDVIYVPSCQFAQALGKYSVFNNHFAAISDTDNLSIYEESDNAEAAAYIVSYKKKNSADYTAADYAQVKENWKRTLVGDENNDPDEEHFAAYLKNLDKNVANYWATMNKGDDIIELWGTKMNSTSGEMTKEYQKLLTMAKGYATYGSKYYNSKELGADILWGLEWMYKNRYGEAEKKGKGWRSTSAFNWWDWQIGSPRALVDIMMIMDGELTALQKKNYISLFDTLCPDVGYDGSNRLNVAYSTIGSGILQENPERVETGVDSIDETYLYVDSGRQDGQGFYKDGSYLYHNFFAMNATYGAEQYEYVAKILPILHGTKFEITNPLTRNLNEWTVNAFIPIMYKGQATKAFMGRDTASGHEVGRALTVAMLQLMDFFEDETREQVKTFIKYTVTNDTTLDYYANLSPKEITTLTNIMEDESIELVDGYTFSKTFYNTDKVMHVRPDYGVSLSMSSERIGSYESINSNNMKGWYTGDGALYIYNDDLQHFSSNYWSTANMYKIPGTTVDTQERAVESIRGVWAYRPPQDFVGGATMDGLYTTAAMSLESFHKETEPTKTATSYGGEAQKHLCSLVANKSYFMFDDEIVCLGSGINANDGYNVLTVLENRKSKKLIDMNNSDDGTAYTITGVEASDVPQEENGPENTIDGSYATRWSAENDCTITWDIGKTETLGYVMLAFYGGNTRATYFDLSVSEDGETWTQVYSGQSSGKTDGNEGFSLGDTKGRYVRYEGHGNSTGTWNSISEVTICPPSKDGKMVVKEPKYAAGEIVVTDAGEWELSDTEAVRENVKWAHVENSSGFYFPEGITLSADKPAGNVGYVELWTDHGVNPENGTYAYAILPAMTQEQTKAYAENPAFEILRNDEKLQAVRENTLGITGIVFWQTQNIEGISVSNPCILMLKDTGDGAVGVSVCDPTQKLSSLSVTLPYKLEMTSGDKEITSKASETATTLHINTDNSHGKTYSAVFSKIK